MDDLQQFFRDSVADRLASLERLTDRALAGNGEALDAIQRIAHNLKGSGTSYGFPEITDAAGDLLRASGRGLGPAIARLTSALAGVGHAAARRLILVVDDDPLISRLLESRLTTTARRVTTMASLEAARAFLRVDRPDVLLLDLFLPDGDGRTLLTEIRADEQLATLPVFVVSAADEPAIVDEVSRLGADAFIAKPFLPDEVGRLVSAALRTESPDSGRAALTTAYRELLEREVPITVASALPETHGPGGKRTEGSDPALSGFVLDVLEEALMPEAAIAHWADGEVGVVTSSPPAQVERAIDRARLRLRTTPHPTVEGALVSFSAGVVSDDGHGLSDAYHRAHRFALDANQQGGDRVSHGSSNNRAGRVLLVEDDTLTAALIIHRLEREGFEVIHEIDGDAAIERAEGGGFALVVIDVQLPGIDGFEVLTRLRADRAFDDTPIVVLTAVGGEREVVRGFELGASDYILKPFSPAELTARLKRFVRR